MTIRDEFEKPTFGYIDIGSAVCFLADLESVPQHHVAKWLLNRGAHKALRTYDTEQSHTDPYAFGLAELQANAANERVATTLILEAVMQHDYLWVDHADANLSDVDSRLRWERDEFWRFVINNGVTVDADRFEDPRDVPAFLRCTTDTAPATRIDHYDTATGRLRSLQRELATLTQVLQEANTKVLRLQEQLQIQSDIADELDDVDGDNHGRQRERRRWSDEQLGELLAQQRSGMKVVDIAKVHGVSPQRISYLLSQAKSVESQKSPQLSNVWSIRKQ